MIASIGNVWLFWHASSTVTCVSSFFTLAINTFFRPLRCNIAHARLASHFLHVATLSTRLIACSKTSVTRLYNDRPAYQFFPHQYVFAFCPFITITIRSVFDTVNILSQEMIAWRLITLMLFSIYIKIYYWEMYLIFSAFSYCYDEPIKSYLSDYILGSLILLVWYFCKDCCLDLFFV